MSQQTNNTTAELPPITIKDKYKVAMVVYDGFTMLDLIGPSEVLGIDQNKFTQVVVGKEANMKVTAMTKGFIFEPTMSFFEAAQLEGDEKFDILVIPGGTYGPEKAFNDPKFMEGLKLLADKVSIVLSVCTGASILAKSGLLDGKNATTNKMAYARYEKMFEKVNWQFRARWVHDQSGKFITSSGVTAGIDAALYLVTRIYGKEFASLVAHTIEFSPTWNPDNDPFADYVSNNKVEIPDELYNDPSVQSNLS